MADGADHRHAEKVFEENAYRLVKDALSDARIQATNLYYQQVKGQKMSNRPETYAAWSSVWASEDFKKKTRKSQVKSRLGAEPHLWWGQLHAKGTTPGKETN